MWYKLGELLFFLAVLGALLAAVLFGSLFLGEGIWLPLF